MLAGEIIDIIEKVAPLSRQQSWDNSGLQIGQRDVEITSALLCTDITEAVLEEAVSRGCGMVISHHPLLFHGLKHLCGLTPQERCTKYAIKHDLVIYSSHTSMDTYLKGVSGRMALKLGINDYEILSSTGEDVGLGVVGNLKEPLEPMAFLERLKQVFAAPVVKYTKSDHRLIKRVAMCGGAGSEFLEQAVSAGADAYISADFKYHEFQMADGRIMIADIGHFESEQYTKEIFSELLSDHITCCMAESDKSPVLIY